MRISFRQYQVHFLDPNHPSISTLPTILHGICQSNITIFSITQFRSITCIRIPRISLHEIKTPNISCLKLTSQIFIHAKRGNKQPITHCWHQFVNSIHENYVIIVFWQIILAPDIRGIPACSRIIFHVKFCPGLVKIKYRRIFFNHLFRIFYSVIPILHIKIYPCQ